MTSYDSLTDEQVTERLAVEVMGWEYFEHIEAWGTRGTDDDGGNSYAHTAALWKPLTDWNHTMEVVEKLVSVPHHLRFRFMVQTHQWADGKPNRNMATEFYPSFGDGQVVEIADWTGNPQPKSWQHAICLAALKAISPDPA